VNRSLTGDQIVSGRRHTARDLDQAQAVIPRLPELRQHVRPWNNE